MPAQPTPNPSALIVPRDSIHPRTKQPRHDITEAMIAARRADLKENGQKQALLVEEDPTRPGHFWINEGEVRWRASYADRDWAGLPTLRVEVEPPRDDPAERFIQSALANDSAIPLSDYDWCRSVGHMYDDLAVPLSKINKRFNRGRNWAEDFWAIYNGTGQTKKPGPDKMPADLADAILDKLKTPGNKNVVKLIVGAPNRRLQREMVRDFDSLTVESARARIEAWLESHKAPAPSTPAPRGGGYRLKFVDPFKQTSPTSRGRDVTGPRAPDARQECEDALGQMERHTRQLQAWWGKLSPAARRECRARALDIAGALEDLEK